MHELEEVKWRRVNGGIPALRVTVYRFIQASFRRHFIPAFIAQEFRLSRVSLRFFWAAFMGFMNQDGQMQMRHGGDTWAGTLAVYGLALIVGGGSVVPSVAQTPTPETPVSEASPWSAPEPWRTDRFYFQTSLATQHFSPSPDHVNQQDLVNGEWRFNSFAATGQWLAGVAFFKNSFGQPSQYVYGGWLVRPFDGLQPLYFKITAGALHGYKEPYQNKIPFNSSGVAPAILPAMGYCFNRVCSELVLFGGAGIMLTLGITVP